MINIKQPYSKKWYCCGLEFSIFHRCNNINATYISSDRNLLSLVPCVVKIEVDFSLPGIFGFGKFISRERCLIFQCDDFSSGEAFGESQDERMGPQNDF